MKTTAKPADPHKTAKPGAVHKTTNHRSAPDAKTHKKRKWIILSVVAVVLIGVRLALPYVVLHYANKTLAGMHGYYGHVNDIDLSIYRGAYVIKDFYIDKVDSTKNYQRTPFISSKIIDLSVEWKSLFHGRFVGELEFSESLMRFTKDKVEPAKIVKDTTDFRKVLKKFMPLQINRFEITKGIIQYIDSATTPQVNIQMDNAHVVAENLSSVHDTALLPAVVHATATLYKGELNFKMKLDPLADNPTFDMDADLKNTSLPELNNFFRAYANFDVSRGTFGLYTEIAAKDKKFIGYVKPVIKDLKVLGPEDRDKSLLNKTWQAFVGAVGVVLKNRKEQQVATKVPIEGEFKTTIIGTWYAVLDLLRNAFIQAINPSIDNQINIESVKQVKPEEKKNFFQKLFNKDEKKK